MEEPFAKTATKP